jgi:hypothetical protein
MSVPTLTCRAKPLIGWRLLSPVRGKAWKTCLDPVSSARLIWAPGCGPLIWTTYRVSVTARGRAIGTMRWGALAYRRA